MAINYEFLNNLMTDPDLADWIRSKEIGMNGPPPRAPIGPVELPEPRAPEEAMPPAVPEIARPNMGPAIEPGSFAGRFIDAPFERPPDAPPPRPTGYAGPGGVELLTGANNPANRIAEPEPPGGRGFKGFLRRALPRMATAAIAAGATPSRFGGGPLDIFAGMQAGQQELERRDMMAYNTARQREHDILNRRKIESDIGRDASQNELNKAQIEVAKEHANYYKSQASQKAEKKPSDVLFEDYRNEQNPEEKEKKKDLWLQSIGHAPKAEKLWGPGKIPGTLVNKETSEVKWIDETAARAARDEEMRKHFGVDPLLWPYRKKGIFAQQPDVEMYIKYGHEGLKKQPGAGANGAPNTAMEMAYAATAKEGQTPAQHAAAAFEYYNRPRITAAEIAQQNRENAQNKAFLAKAGSEYQKALNDAEDEYKKAKKELDKPGVRPGAVDPKSRPRPVPTNPQAKAEYDRQLAAAWALYNEKDAVIRKQLVDAKNAAHRAYQAAQAQYDPENFRAVPGYDENARPIPVPGDLSTPSASEYLKNRKKTQRPAEIGILDLTTR